MAFQSVGQPTLGSFNIAPVQTPQAPQMFGVNIAEKYMEGLAAKRDMEARARQQAIQEEQLAIQREGQALRLKQMQESAAQSERNKLVTGKWFDIAMGADMSDPKVRRDVMLMGYRYGVPDIDKVAALFESEDFDPSQLSAFMNAGKVASQNPQAFEEWKKTAAESTGMTGFFGSLTPESFADKPDDAFTPKPQGNAFVVVGGKARPVVQLEGSGGYAMVNGQGQYVPVPAGAEIQFGEIAGTPEQFDPSKLKETQSKGYLYGSRMNQANEILAQIEEGVAEIGFFEGLKRAGEKAVVGSDAFNRLASEEVQRMDQAQRNFINAVLRRESGAVISDAEFENARKQYFVVPGDTKATVRQKRQNRELAIKNMLEEAGAPADSGTTGEVIAPQSSPPSGEPEYEWTPNGGLRRIN